MNRRHVIAAGAALIAAPATGLAQPGHNHAEASALNELFDAANKCVTTGLVCIDHCQQMFAAGDVSLAACARDVDQLVSICGTLAKLASLRSPYVPAMAKVALTACQDCETECRKHADKHAACKACADACATCAKQCKQIAS
jgi:Cys-rich four helix bundle protein (predicted Tat secretion target)